MSLSFKASEKKHAYAITPINFKISEISILSKGLYRHLRSIYLGDRVHFCKKKTASQKFSFYRTWKLLKQREFG